MRSVLSVPTPMAFLPRIPQEGPGLGREPVIPTVHTWVCLEVSDLVLGFMLRGSAGGPLTAERVPSSLRGLE